MSSWIGDVKPIIFDKSDEVLSIMKHSRAQILSIIEDGQKSGEIRSDISQEHLSLMILGALRLIVTRWRLSGFAFDLQTEGVALWESLKILIKTSKCQNGIRPLLRNLVYNGI